MTYEELKQYFIEKNSLTNIKERHNKFSINNSPYLKGEDIYTYLKNRHNIDCRKEDVIKLLKETAIQEKVKEKDIQNRLARELNGITEVVLENVGRVDIVTNNEVIEVKRYDGNNWKHALGQVIAYKERFPHLQPRLHLYGRIDPGFVECYKTCKLNGVKLTYEST